LQNYHLNFLIVDDHPVFRKGLISIFQDWKKSVIIFEASDTEEMFSVLKNHSIDLLTLDINLPGNDGISILKKLRRNFPDIKILIVTMYKHSLMAEQAIKRGANGFITKDNISENLIKAAETVLKGDVFADAFFCLEDNEIDKQKELYFLLTDSEKRIFKLLAEGKNYKQIGLDTGKSHKTIDNQRSSIMSKLKIKNATELVKIALKLNIIKI